MKINRSISIDEELWRDATEAAAQLDRSFSWLVSEALRRLAAPPSTIQPGVEALPAVAGFGASRPAPKGGKR